MAKREKGGFDEDSDFVEVLSVGVDGVKNFNEDAEIDYDSDEVEDGVESDLADGVEFGTLDWEAASEGESKDKDGVDEIGVLGPEKLFFGINDKPQWNQNDKSSQREYIRWGNIKVIEVHG